MHKATLVIACFLLACISVEAASFKVRSKHRLHAQQLPVTNNATAAASNNATSSNSTQSNNNNTVTINWPRNSLTGQRFEGIKEFIIVLHDNLLLEQEEEKVWMANERLTFDGRLRKLQSRLQGQQEAMVPFVASLERLNRRYKQVNDSIDELTTHLKARTEALERAKRVINDTNWNWNNTISNLRTQLELVQGAIADVRKVFPLLNHPNPGQDIASQLRRTRNRVANTRDSRLVSLLEMAMDAVNTVQDVKAMKQLLKKLLADLVTHSTDVNEDLTLAEQSRVKHLVVLERKLGPYQARVNEINQQINTTASVIPIIVNQIRVVENDRQEVLKNVQKVENKIQALRDSYNETMQVYESEMENMLTRGEIVEQLHQQVKARLMDMSESERDLLLSINNILVPRGSNVLQWNMYYTAATEGLRVTGVVGKTENGSDVTNVLTTLPLTGTASSQPFGFRVPRAIDPKDGLSVLCANWRFDERPRDRFVVDSGPYGFDGRLHGPKTMRSPRGFDGRGGSLEFDGMGSYVDVGRLGNIGRSLNSFTIELWVRTVDTHPSLSSLLKVIDSGLTSVLAIETNRRVGRMHNGVYPEGQQRTTDLDFESGTLLCFLRDRTGRVLAGHVKVPLFDNKWHRIQWSVVDAENNHMVFYLDDQVYPWVATIEQSPKTFGPLENSLFIGAGNNRGTPEGFFDGSMDNVRFFCNGNLTTPSQGCCRTCVANVTKACGDMCIPADAACFLSTGCACDAPAPTPVPTVAPTQAPVANTSSEDALNPSHPTYNTLVQPTTSIPTSSEGEIHNDAKL